MWPRAPSGIMLLSLLFVAFLSLTASPGAVNDPVDAFIARVRAAPDSLSAIVAERSVVVGAAVGALVDHALEGGSRDDAIDLARRIATVHRKINGSTIPLTLVETAAAWTPDDLATRRRAVALEKQAAAARDLGGFDRALELYDEARTLYESIGDRRSVAVNYGSLGVVQWHRNNMGEVYSAYQKALEARRAVEDHILEGRTLNGLGSANYRIGNYSGAIEWYRQAVALRQETRDRRGLGTSLTYLGNAYYQLGRLTPAREAYDRAVRVLEGIGDAEQTFDVLNGMASLYSDMGRPAASNDTYRRAIGVAARAGLAQREIMARRNFADNLRRTSRFREALAELDTVGTLLSRHPDAEETMLLHRDRGATRMNMGDVDGARDDVLAYLADAEALGNPARKAEALINVGYLYRELGAYDRALATAEKALAAAESIGDARNQRLAHALAGAVEQASGRYAESLSQWEAALELDTVAGAEQAVQMDRVSIAGAKASMGREREARDAFRALLPDARASGWRVVEWSVYFGIGHTFEDENPDSAAANYERALAVVEHAGTGVDDDAVQSGYLSGRRRFYYEEVARYYASRHAVDPGGGWSARAFATMERAKARGLVRLLENSIAGQGSAQEDSVLEAIYAIDGTDADAAARRHDLERRYARLREERVERAVGRLGDDAGRLAGLDDVAGALPERTALLEYALGDTASLLWVVDRDGSDLVALPPRAALEQDISRLRDALARPGSGDAVLREEARRLNGVLIAPAGGRLVRARDVVVVPDGALFELPFEVLVAGGDDEGPWEGLDFFARRHTTTYAPSATVYLEMARARGRDDYATDVLAVANPDFTRLDRGGAAPLPPLPHADDEVRRISEAVGVGRCEVLSGAAATEEVLKQTLARGTPRVLHLATHGLVDPIEPSRSSIALARGDGDGGDDDGYLHTLEILSMRDDVGLVVMSACESALGKVSRGEGVVGLSRAFIASGARAVVASLWAVSDESTAELMSVFYQRMMKQKEPAGRALNEARLALIGDERYSHPFYWSPFVVIGTNAAPW